MGYLLFLQENFEESLECASICESIIKTKETQYSFNYDLDTKNYFNVLKRKIKLRKIEIFEKKEDLNESMNIIKTMLRKNYR